MRTGKERSNWPDWQVMVPAFAAGPAPHTIANTDQEARTLTPTEWQIPAPLQPKPEHYRYDLDWALSAVVSVKSHIPGDAFTADILGVERSGNGVVIRENGLVLTIGYLVTEAETIWLGLGNGRVVPGHALGYDQATGFGLVQALARVDLPTLRLGSSTAAELGERVVVAGAGGRAHSVAARIVAKQEFAGYWEYVLDQAIFTAPAHPYWGGTAVIGPAGDLIGIGSLRLDQAREGGREEHLNMIVPIDLLKPILDDLATAGRTRLPPRPWLGIYAVEVDGRIAIAGIAGRGPAEAAGLQTGDIVVTVAGKPVSSLAAFFRAIWALGSAGVEVPLSITREGRARDVTVTSGDRSTFLKAPRLH